MEQSEQWVEHTAAYHPRNPKESPLWNLLNNHYENFERNYQERFEKEYGFFRPVISEVVHDYLKCGDLNEGFARVHCPECHHSYLLAFSCRGRWFCPSCHAKKVILFGEHLRHEILYPVPHRQYVFSIPKILRVYFKYDRKLLGKLSQCANASLLNFLRTATGIEDGVLGAVMNKM
ncbi:MAG: transposase zinc-binding domain-containing protein [Bacteroidota bacterium]|nr:transposase zinc-binding domain-containing protein [Bacteroidota bacterium]